jgi:hypothetical protein
MPISKSQGLRSPIKDRLILVSVQGLGHPVLIRSICPIKIQFSAYRMPAFCTATKFIKPVSIKPQALAFAEENEKRSAFCVKNVRASDIKTHSRTFEIRFYPLLAVFFRVAEFGTMVADWIGHIKHHLPTMLANYNLRGQEAPDMSGAFFCLK